MITTKILTYYDESECFVIVCVSTKIHSKICRYETFVKRIKFVHCFVIYHRLYERFYVELHC